ncbi:MAG: SAM-dependent DNA methyltransferase [Candidatus Tectomicrobia bacterium]|nr:SAM-dependent DNA methyltransferase [Candidatus Tectomicrobia bacterium]
MKRRGRGKSIEPTLFGEESWTQPLDTKSMEQMLWDAACQIRGEKDAPKFKDYILPLLFVKRLSDVFEDELNRLSEEFGDLEVARELVEADHQLVRFYIPSGCLWSEIRKTTTNIGQKLTDVVRAIAKANPTLQGVIDQVDFNATIHEEREISDDALSRLIESLSDLRYRLGLNDVEPDFLGRCYEYLLRKFAEDSGQSAGEFFTPKEVGWLIAHLMKPEQGMECYDFACGSAGLLIKLQLWLEQRVGRPVPKPLRLYGQELTASSFAIARMNVIVHDMECEIVRGDTIRNSKFLDNSSLKRFDIVVANPMWMQKNFETKLYEGDPFERFEWGYAPENTADWAWVQHAYASLKDTGRAAIVLDTGAVSRGSGNQGSNREKAIRKAFVDNDVIEGVILLPDNLFYNTSAAGIILLLNRAKPAHLKGKIILINASEKFQKGRPKNFIPEESITKIADAYHVVQDMEKFVCVITNEEAAANDYNLSPSRYIVTGAETEYREIPDLLAELATLEVEAAKLGGELKAIFEGRGIDGDLSR